MTLEEIVVPERGVRSPIREVIITQIEYATEMVNGIADDTAESRRYWASVLHALTAALVAIDA